MLETGGFCEEFEKLLKLTESIEIDGPVQNVIDVGVKQWRQEYPKPSFCASVEEENDIIDAALYLLVSIYAAKKSHRNGKQSKPEKIIRENIKNGMLPIENLRDLRRQMNKEKTKSKGGVPSSENKPTKPKRGHHVINNGVLKIHRDIAKQVIEGDDINYFNNRQYQELVNDNILDVNHSSINPLSEIEKTIQNEMRVELPERDYDRNAENFGKFKNKLCDHVTKIIRIILTEGVVNDRSMTNLKNLIQQEVCDLPICSAVFVDMDALSEWLREGKGKTKLSVFRDCANQVAQMFRDIMDVDKLKNWVQIFFHDIHIKAIRE